MFHLFQLFQAPHRRHFHSRHKGGTYALLRKIQCTYNIILINQSEEPMFST